MGRWFGRGLGAEPLDAGGHWELRGEESGRNLPAARGIGGALSARGCLHFFNKNNAFLCIFRPKYS